MNDTPLVSVIIPVYNTEKYIDEAIKSIRNQTYKNLEIIILNDASTDGTAEIIKKHALEDSRINVINNQKNLYIACNRNKGISSSKGKYIVWQDADDLSLPERVEKLVNFMEKNSEVGICGSYIQSFNEAGDLDVRKYPSDDASIRKYVFKFSPVAQPAAIVRKRCFDELGIFDEKYPPAEDIDLSFRIGTKYKFANINEVLIKYRVHNTSATHKNLRKQIMATLKIRRNYLFHKSYRFCFTDGLAYIATFLVSLLPPKPAITLFVLARDLVLRITLPYRL